MLSRGNAAGIEIQPPVGLYPGFASRLQGFPNFPRVHFLPLPSGKQLLNCYYYCSSSN
jgi:hypothetical protein